MIEPVPSSLSKSYAPRGPLQQFRFVETSAFNCVRCGESKKSKLIAVISGDWKKRICNGCYGRLLALYEIKSGTANDDERCEALATSLLSAITLDEQRQAERVYSASENRAVLLCPESLRFIATAEHVARLLDEAPQLEWSPAVIGLCKAVESEIVNRVLRRLAVSRQGIDFSLDMKDKDLGRVAAFCVDSSRKPPELGVFGHFLQTVIHSQSRRDSSILIREFFSLAQKWPGSNWLLSVDGLHLSLAKLTGSFRNRAAHIDELSQQDYECCRDLVIGEHGMIWQLLVATK